MIHDRLDQARIMLDDICHDEKRGRDPVVVEDLQHPPGGIGEVVIPAVPSHKKFLHILEF